MSTPDEKGLTGLMADQAQAQDKRIAELEARLAKLEYEVRGEEPKNLPVHSQHASMHEALDQNTYHQQIANKRAWKVSLCLIVAW